MCRPPCCNDSGGQGAGIAAVALITGAALVAAKIGPFVANTVHVVLEVIRLVALTTGLVLALAVITWATIALTHWQLRHKALAVARTRAVTMRTWQQMGPADRPDCLACGGTGTVLRALSGGQYQPTGCPVCEPALRAG
jgi:hypothetical protein